MERITVTVSDITVLDTDAIVNAANSDLLMGGGVCGAIFRAAGPAQLQEACDALAPCPTGSAVITPGYRLKAGYIIHAVGPVWHGGDRCEKELLYSCYKTSLEIAAEYGLKTVAFPLISSGIYGYPVPDAWETAITACRGFLMTDTGKDMSVVFAVLREDIARQGRETIERLCDQSE